MCGRSERESPMPAAVEHSLCETPAARCPIELCGTPWRDLAQPRARACVVSVAIRASLSLSVGAWPSGTQPSACCGLPVPAPEYGCHGTHLWLLACASGAFAASASGPAGATTTWWVSRGRGGGWGLPEGDSQCPPPSMGMMLPDTRSVSVSVKSK